MSPYGMIIQWSNEDDAFIVSLPEFLSCTTHGETYTEAVQNGQEMIESLVEYYRQERKALPELTIFSFPQPA